MGMLIEFAKEMYEVDSTTLSLMCFICGIAKLLIKNHLPNSAMVFVMFPFTIMFSVASYTLFYRLELFATNRPDQWLMWLITSATVGVLLTLCATALLMSIADFFTNRSHRRITGTLPRS
jgi:hypothetical protein